MLNRLAIGFIILLVSTPLLAARTINWASVDGSTSTTVASGSNISVSINVSTAGSGTDDNWQSTGWLIAGSSGALNCQNTSNHNNDGNYTETFNITAPSSGGTYNVYFVAYSNNGCSSGASAQYILSNAVITISEMTILSATVNGASSVTVDAGGAVNVEYTIQISGGNSEVEGTDWSISTTPPGGYTCADSSPDSPNNVNGTYTTGFNVSAPATPGTYNLYLVASDRDNCGGRESDVFTLSNALIVTPPVPRVDSMDRASFDPTTSNTIVDWNVLFNSSVTGVDASDFILVSSGGASGASITSVTGSGDNWTVSVNTGTGTSGSLQLNLIDDDSILSGATPLGGSGPGNGDFNGQSYTLIAPVCSTNPDIVFCDDFERSNPESVGNGWTIAENNLNNCNGNSGNRRCAGIDSDIPPFSNYSNPRANPTRAMFTRWNPVYVTSPVIDMGGKLAGELSFWMRRGHDDFSECPEAAGENYLVQYYASDNSWKILAQYPSSPSASLCDGRIFTPTIELPEDALHANFRLRFYQPSGSGDSGSGGAPGVLGYDYWHMDNIVVREKTAASFVGAFCDNFEGGLGRWSISAVSAPSGATIGDVDLGTLENQSPTHSLDLRWGYGVASTFKTDLTGVSGDISYWVRSGTTGNFDPDNNEDLLVEYFNNAGDWINLATYYGSAATGATFTATHTIPDDAKHSLFRLRFRHLNASGYDRDYWHVDDVCVGDLIPTADLSISKVRQGAIVPGANAIYAINVSNLGPGTLSGSIEVTDNLPNTLSFLSASGSGWVCSANFQNVTCNWSGTLAASEAAPLLTLTTSVASSASGTISNTANVSGTAVDNNPANNSSTDTAGIYIPGYVFTDKVCPTGVAIGSGPSPCNLVDWSSVISAQPVNSIYITALNSSGIPTQLSGTNPTTVNFDFALSCINPVSNAGIQATFSAVVDPLPLCAANGNIPTTWSNSMAAVFDATLPSVGPFEFNYTDVGNIELYVRNALATTQIGQTGAFVVKPAGFQLSSIHCTTADAANCGAGALPGGDNPAASSISGPSFIRSGDAFSVTVTAINSAGNATPNYGQEISPESVLLTPALIAPLDCDANPANDPDCAVPALGGNFAAFSSGVATGSNFSWDEVGIITLTPSVADADYLSTGNVTGTTSGNVGRFYPHHFSLGSQTLLNRSDLLCGSGFSYLGENFDLSFVLTAQNSSNLTTTNYTTTNGYARLNTVAELQYGAADTSRPVNLTSRLSNSSGAITFTSGVSNISDTMRISRLVDGSPDGPYNTSIGVAPQDEDLVSLTTFTFDVDASGSNDTAEIGTTLLYYGQLSLSNAYGSELTPVTVNLSLRFYDDTLSSFLPNLADNCTPFNVTDIDLSSATYIAPLSATNLGLTGVGTFNSGLASISMHDDINPLAGPGVTGEVIFSMTVPAYLHFDWNSDTIFSDDPVAKASFGIYQGDSRQIYFRQIYP